MIRRKATSTLGSPGVTPRAASKNECRTQVPRVRAGLGPCSACLYGARTTGHPQDPPGVRFLLPRVERRASIAGYRGEAGGSPVTHRWAPIVSRGCPKLTLNRSHHALLGGAHRHIVSWRVDVVFVMRPYMAACVAAVINHPRVLTGGFQQASGTFTLRAESTRHTRTSVRLTMRSACVELIKRKPSFRLIRCDNSMTCAPRIDSA